MAKLVFKDGTSFAGENFGANQSMAGEIVFATGMMGYPESLTDPSYKGQILVLTYPLVGNYGVPEKKLWESDRIMVSGVVVSQYIDTPSHFQSTKTLAAWFKEEKLPLLQIKDTRFLAQKIRDQGVGLGKIVCDKAIAWYDPNKENLVAQVSTKEIIVQEPSGSVKREGERGKGNKREILVGQKTIILIDCGAKRNIQNVLLARGVRVVTIPWNFNPFRDADKLAARGIDSFDGIVVSNGPGDPMTVDKTIATVQEAMKKNMPTLGICLGHQILTLAAGGQTAKLKYGHRGQNQPCTMAGTNRCFITTQNHGFAASKIPSGFTVWFTNANDNSNEGIIHKNKPFMSVQFHPEATPGPTDAEWIFDFFLDRVKREGERGK